MNNFLRELVLIQKTKLEVKHNIVIFIYTCTVSSVLDQKLTEMILNIVTSSHQANKVYCINDPSEV